LIIRPGADRERVLETWDDFIFSHHFDVFEDFYDSSRRKPPPAVGGELLQSIPRGEVHGRQSGATRLKPGRDGRVVPGSLGGRGRGADGRRLSTRSSERTIAA
jgi:hypothetical protein